MPRFRHDWYFVGVHFEHTPNFWEASRLPRACPCLHTDAHNASRILKNVSDRGLVAGSGTVP